MAPTATETATDTQAPKAFHAFNRVEAVASQSAPFIPLKLSGALESFKQFDLTTTIGTQFENINLTEILHSSDCDLLLRDLAIIISQRGVCVFPKQADLTIENQKLLARKLGELTCRPHTSGLHIHPLNQTKMPDGTIDAELTTLARDPTTKLFIKETGFSTSAAMKKQSRLDGWHTDSSYENLPIDYTLLHMKTTPGAGGDTLFASAYEVYDLLSEPYQKFLEGLTATFMPPHHKPSDIESRMWKGPRGSPENIGAELRASHPCVRTNPVTGWKYVYAFGHHLEGFDGLADVESRVIKDHIERLVTENPHLQLRFRWHPEDLVIWDNRGVYHSPTYDYTAKRLGHRICGVGEKPYFDSRSSSRKYALNL